VTPSEPGSSVPSDSVDLIDKNNAGCLGFSLYKKISDPAGSHSNEHLYKIGTAHRIEWNFCFSSNSFCQQSFPGTGPSNQYNTLGHFSTKTTEFFRFFKKLYHFEKFGFSFVRSRYILESNLRFIARKKFCSAFTERKRLPAPPCSPHEVDKETN